MGGNTERRLDYLKVRYPRSAELRDKSTVSLRPMTAADEDKLIEFFCRLPMPERRLFKDDVTNPAVVRIWCERINYEAVLPILATDGDRIVGDASLHREKRGWMSHVARVRVSVDPDARGRGLATRLVKELIEIAPKFGICIIDAEIFEVQKAAMKVFEDMEFINVASLPQHALDLNHKAHDLHVFSLTVAQPEQLAVDPDEDPEHIDIGGSG